MSMKEANVVKGQVLKGAMHIRCVMQFLHTSKFDDKVCLFSGFGFVPVFVFRTGWC